LQKFKKLGASVNAFFQQDLAPCHAFKKVKKLLSGNKISCLERPENSPDFIPLENLWSICKEKLGKLDLQQKRK
jgi:transposase